CCFLPRPRLPARFPYTTLFRSVFTRPRGLHLHQAGILAGELLPASLFDTAMVAYQVDFHALKHPLCIYIPKSESSDEALWWRDRSEEHTSELQSLRHLVCRLLL